MSVDDLRAAMRAVEAYVACLQSLSNASAVRDQRLWTIRPKVHYFLHLVHRMSLTGRNPRHEATWNNEDFVGRIAAALVSIVLFERYLLLLAVTWDKTGARLAEGRWCE